jgi:superfamily II DNA or RNA helicase
MLSELTQDPKRNALIADDVAGTRNGGTILVLSDRKAHVYAIRSLLEARGVPSVALTGEMNTTARAEALEAIRERNARVLVATGQLIGEGFDLPAMSVLFLTTPIRFDGRVIQYLGRVLRPAPGKSHAIVYDYRDSLIGPLLASANARARLYDRAAQSNIPDALGHTAKSGIGQEVEAPVGIAAGGEP